MYLARSCLSHFLSLSLSVVPYRQRAGDHQQRISRRSETSQCKLKSGVYVRTNQQSANNASGSATRRDLWTRGGSRFRTGRDRGTWKMRLLRGRGNVLSASSALVSLHLLCERFLPSPLPAVGVRSTLNLGARRGTEERRSMGCSNGRLLQRLSRQPVRPRGFSSLGLCPLLFSLLVHSLLARCSTTDARTTLRLRPYVSEYLLELSALPVLWPWTESIDLGVPLRGHNRSRGPRSTTKYILARLASLSLSHSPASSCDW